LKHQPLWYVRREGKLLGPHPRQVVVDGLLLGRLAWDDPASTDGRLWQPLKSYPEIIAALEGPARQIDADPGEPSSTGWQNERLAAARRWADERSGLDRRTGKETGTETAPERRRTDERRQQRELLQVVLWRRLRRELDIAFDRAATPRFWWIPVAAVVCAGIAVAWWQREPGNISISLATRVVDCAAPAGPGVNWAGCDRPGAALAGANLSNARLAGVKLEASDLRRADLTYANLSGARLTGAQLTGARLFGADLTGADLVSAVLDGADLSFADLRNARLDSVRLGEARLGNALWTDGRRCAAASVGRCD
jgi:hypothetical protein